MSGVTRPGNAELRDLAVQVATAAAQLVAEARREGVSVAATKSSAIDVVTDADRASEALVRRMLHAARPHDAVWGEEEGRGSGDSGVEWVVDPIDGTVNYLYGRAEYAVSVAARVGGESVAAAVVDVPRSTVYAAARGEGATRDGARLQVRPVPPFAERLVLTGFGYDAEVRASQAATVARLLPRIRDIRRLGSCALDLCHLAEGLADGYVEEGPAPWDHAAGSLVLTEASGRFALLPGVGGRDVVVAAPADGFDEFTEVLASCGFFR